MNAYESDIDDVPRHRMHKWSRIAAPSKAWRERLLNNCVQRMKNDRESLLNACRKARTQLVEREHTLLRKRKRSVDSLSECSSTASLTSSEISSLIADLEAALDAERRCEERAVLAAYEDGVRDTEEDIAELVQFQERLNIKDDFVMCPMCGRDGLTVRNGVVFCGCGLRVDGGTYDNLTLDLVRERLADVVAQHQDCRDLSFQVVEQVGFRFLAANCSGCGQFCIVV